MYKFRFTNKAVEDLATIWNYTFDTWSESQADAYYLLLIENCQEIASNPELGKNYTEISKNLKGLRAGRHIIFYRKIEVNDVEIIRILHEQMDLKHRVREK
jgi:Plasmid stabilization system protein